MKEHVSNLELSRKLKELKVKQVSLFKWNVPYDLKYEDIGLFSQKEWEEFATDHIPQDGQMYSAFLASEIAESLPLTVCVKKRIHTREYFLEIQKLSLGWTIYYMGLHGVTDKTLPNALAKMKIYLLEHGLMEVKKCKHS